jgi:hypothetical protein
LEGGLDQEAAAGPPTPICRTGFVLFVLVTAVMFLRPAELLPSIKNLPIYEPLIVACLLASLPVVLAQFQWGLLNARPATLCVIAMLPAVFLSNLARGDLFAARMGAFNFAKTLLYYLLLVGLVNTPERFRTFLKVIVVFIFGIAALSLLNHQGILHVEALDAMEQREGYDEESGERVMTIRLQASGIFNDPNDFSLILVTGILLCTHLAWEARGLLQRLPFSLPLPVFFYALALTRSRGGFLCMLGGFSVYGICRLGWRRALPIGLVVLPVMLVVFGGRQTRIDLGDEGDTGHARVSIWSEGLQHLKGSPIFGIGQGQMLDQVGIVAHNSFVHAYTELGMVGGTLFLAAFYLPITYLRQQQKLDKLEAAGAGVHGAKDEFDDAQASGTDDDSDQQPHAPDDMVPLPDSELRSWLPCMLAMVVACAVGLSSLSRTYTVTTYLILGVVGAFSILLTAGRREAAPAAPFGKVFARLGVISVCFVVCLYVFVRLVT